MSTRDKVRSLHKKIGDDVKRHQVLLKQVSVAVGYWKLIAQNVEDNCSKISELLFGECKAVRKEFRKVALLLIGKQAVAQIKKSIVALRVAAVAGEGFAGSAAEFADKLKISPEEARIALSEMNELGILKAKAVEKPQSPKPSDTTPDFSIEAPKSKWKADGFDIEQPKSKDE